MTYIPDKIIIVSKSTKTDSGYYPAFIVPSDNKKILETALRWATSVRSHPVQVEIENKPCKAKIIGLDFRGNGGRAWQVVIYDKYLVDLREDTLLEILKDGKVLNGETEENLVWVRLGGQSKMVVENGKTYKCIREEELKAVEKVKNKKLITNPIEMKYYKNEYYCYLYLGKLKNKDGDILYGKVQFYTFGGNFSLNDYIELTKHPPKNKKKITTDNKHTKEEVVNKIVEDNKNKLIKGLTWSLKDQQLAEAMSNITIC